MRYHLFVDDGRDAHGVGRTFVEGTWWDKDR